MVRISDIIRAEFAEEDNKRDAGLKTPENIVRYDDIIYGTESKWQKLDVYRQKDATGKASSDRQCSWRWMGIR